MSPDIGWCEFWIDLGIVTSEKYGMRAFTAKKRSHWPSEAGLMLNKILIMQLVVRSCFKKMCTVSFAETFSKLQIGVYSLIAKLFLCFF